MKIEFFVVCVYLISSMQKITDSTGSLPNKSRKKNEEKMNINIFLAPNVPELELDLGSDSESGIRQINGKSVCYGECK